MPSRHIILASNSPRRRQLLSGLDIDFEVKVLPDIEESYPHDLPLHDTAEYIAREKAQAYLPTIAPDDLIITADTIVIVEGQILGKPADTDEATRMLQLLSGRTHQVVTGVCLTYTDGAQLRQRSFSVTTDVTFANLTDQEIGYYIDRYHPFDKAGSYGVQEWIGYIGVSSINGSFYNVMGLPIQRIYQELQKISAI